MRFIHAPHLLLLAVASLVASPAPAQVLHSTPQPSNPIAITLYPRDLNARAAVMHVTTLSPKELPGPISKRAMPAGATSRAVPAAAVGTESKPTGPVRVVLLVAESQQLATLNQMLTTIQQSPIPGSASTVMVCSQTFGADQQVVSQNCLTLTNGVTMQLSRAPAAVGGSSQPMVDTITFTAQSGQWTAR